MVANASSRHLKHWPALLALPLFLCLTLMSAACTEEPTATTTGSGGRPDTGYVPDTGATSDTGNQGNTGEACSTAADCAFGLICHAGHCLDTTGICGTPDIGAINALDQDSDCDGLTDIEEFSARYFVDGQWKQTDPNDPDSDGDGVIDGVELGRTSSPDPCCAPYFQPDADLSTTTSPVNPDSDGDSLVEGAEDVDRDGQVDPGETDANKRDSDGDGLFDNAELNG
ncbi:MAG: hypothetical protein LBM75_08810, partial [Myxococcales bacterium]|nr:hypothetical protein [Myxococcales bacterium]